MRIVLDTNVLIAAFIARGTCHDLLEHVVREHEAYTSDFIFREFRDKLTGKLGIAEELVDQAIDLQRSRLIEVEPLPVPASASRDPDDAAILGTALAAEATCLVTGDNDLLALENYRGVRIVAPAEFWQYEAESG